MFYLFIYFLIEFIAVLQFGFSFVLVEWVRRNCKGKQEEFVSILSSGFDICEDFQLQADNVLVESNPILFCINISIYYLDFFFLGFKWLPKKAKLKRRKQLQISSFNIRFVENFMILVYALTMLLIEFLFSIVLPLFLLFINFFIFLITKFRAEQVILKIIKHCKEFSPSLVTGQLLGLDVGSVLEVTNCFPFPV